MKKFLNRKSLTLFLYLILIFIFGFIFYSNYNYEDFFPKKILKINLIEDRYKNKALHDYKNDEIVLSNLKKIKVSYTDWIPVDFNIVTKKSQKLSVYYNDNKKEFIFLLSGIRLRYYYFKNDNNNKNLLAYIKMNWKESYNNLMEMKNIIEKSEK